MGLKSINRIIIEIKFGLFIINNKKYEKCKKWQNWHLKLNKSKKNEKQ